MPSLHFSLFSFITRNRHTTRTRPLQKIQAVTMPQHHELIEAIVFTSDMSCQSYNQTRESILSYEDMDDLTKKVNDLYSLQNDHKERSLDCVSTNRGGSEENLVTCQGGNQPEDLPDPRFYLQSGIRGKRRPTIAVIPFPSSSKSNDKQPTKGPLLRRWGRKMVLTRRPRNRLCRQRSSE